MIRVALRARRTDVSPHARRFAHGGTPFVSTRAVPVAVDAAFARCCFVMNGLSTTSNELTPGGYRPKIREQCKQYPCAFTSPRPNPPHPEHLRIPTAVAPSRGRSHDVLCVCGLKKYSLPLAGSVVARHPGGNGVTAGRRRRRRRSRLLRLHRSFPLRLIQRFVVVIRLSVRRIDFRSPPSRQLRVDVRPSRLRSSSSSSRPRPRVVASVVASSSSPSSPSPSLGTAIPRFASRARSASGSAPIASRGADRTPDRPTAGSRGPAVRNDERENASRRECERNARDDRPTRSTTPIDRGAHASARARAKRERTAPTSSTDRVARRRTANGERRFRAGRALGRNRVDPRERWGRAVDTRRLETLRA